MGQPTTEQYQQIKIPAQNTRKVLRKKTYSHTIVKPKTDSFVQVISNINPWVLGFGVLSLTIGALVLLIIILKLTPVGKLVSKGWNGVIAMFKALIAWKPKGK